MDDSTGKPVQNSAYGDSPVSFLSMNDLENEDRLDGPAAGARIPRRVQTGDRIGIAALSGVVDPERLQRGVQAVRALGFEAVLGSNLTARQGFLAGTDEQRLGAFEELLRDESLAAIWFARGGYGATRLLPKVNWELLTTTPRVYLGYSDLTPLLLEIERRTGWASLHAPMVAADLAEGLESGEQQALLAALGGTVLEPIIGRQATGSFSVEGIVRGGCLSMLVAAVGTEYTPQLSEILLLEDVDEPQYRLDRMVTQLAQSGALAPVQAVAVGCKEEDDAGWLEVLEATGLPALVGLNVGHTRPNYVIPLGARARLTPSGLTVANSEVPL